MFDLVMPEKQSDRGSGGGGGTLRERPGCAL